MARENRVRVHGPYQHGNRWRIVVVRRGGRKDPPEAYDTYEEACEVRDKILKKANAVTIRDLIEQYVEHLRTLGLEAITVTTQRERLRRFFIDDMGRPIDTFTAARGKERYTELRTRFAVQTHRLTLMEGRRFMTWCLEEGLIRKSPLEKVKPLGKAKRSKPQLEFDEAQRLLATGLDAMRSGDVGGFYVWLTLGLDLRCSEILRIEARHVNDHGRLLSLRKTKTRDRRLVVPDALAGPLSSLAKERGQGAVFATSRHAIHYHVDRLCKLAEVPEVGPQGLRATHATLSTAVGATGPMLCAAMGWTSEAVGDRHYVNQDVKHAVRTERVLTVLQGGRSPDSDADRLGNSSGQISFQTGLAAGGEGKS